MEFSSTSTIRSLWLWHWMQCLNDNIRVLILEGGGLSSRRSLHVTFVTIELMLNLTSHDFMRLDFTRLYATWIYTTLHDLTLHDFMRPDFTQLYATWLYTTLRNLTLHDFTRLDFTQLYATWLYTTLRDLTLHDFTRLDYTRLYTTWLYTTCRINSWKDKSRKVV
jgi:hypothetical protein